MTFAKSHHRAHNNSSLFENRPYSYGNLQRPCEKEFSQRVENRTPPLFATQQETTAL